MTGRDNRGRRHFNRGGRDRSGQDRAGQAQFNGNSGNNHENRIDNRQRKRDDRSGLNYDKNSTVHEKSRWIAPKLNTDPLPVLKCSHCGQTITDSHSALTDRHTGDPVHFDCVLADLSKQETLGANDVISYIGGGRFGIVNFNSEKGEQKKISIKKIFEWEDKEKRAQWRDIIADHYSIT